MLPHDKDNNARTNIFTQLDAALKDSFAILSHSLHNNLICLIYGCVTLCVCTCTCA